MKLKLIETTIIREGHKPAKSYEVVNATTGEPVENLSAVTLGIGAGKDVLQIQVFGYEHETKEREIIVQQITTTPAPATAPAG